MAPPLPDVVLSDATPGRVRECQALPRIRLRFVPHTGHNPAHDSWHNGFIGSIRKICSRTSCRKSMTPSW